MAGEQHSAGEGAAASVHRSRSARLADQGEFNAVLFQCENHFSSLPPEIEDFLPANARFTSSAATAALYVTHPDRRLSVREPAMADTQLFRENLPSLLFVFGDSRSICEHRCDGILTALVLL